MLLTTTETITKLKAYISGIYKYYQLGTLIVLTEMTTAKCIVFVINSQHYAVINNHCVLV